ncbi:MAG: diguanylate cyclase [Gammaproteobacteria bacterium]
MDDQKNPAEAKPRLLVVDDSKLMRVAAERGLRGEFDVVHATDGEDGWSRLSDDPAVQIVFSDLSMPRLDGFQLLARMRASEDPRIRRMPVIIVTGEEDDDSAREQALAKGATDFIRKPFDLIELKTRARAFAESVRNLRAIEERAERLAAQATVDALTGLPNRQQFLERLKQHRSFARRHRQDLSVMRLVIDGFEALETHAGAAGLRYLLQRVASTLQQRLRREDGVGRIDAGAFGVSLPSSNPVGAKYLAERLRRDLASLRVPGDAGARHLTLTVGVMSAHSETESTAEVLLERLAELTAWAGQQGGDRVVTERDRPPPAPGPAPLPPVTSVDEALQLLAVGQTARVTAHLQALLERLLPLLELGDAQQRQWLQDRLMGAEAKPSD